MGKNAGKNVTGVKLYFIILLLDLIIGGVWYYISFPALNIHNRDFWLILIVVFTADTLAIALANLGSFALRNMSGKEFLHKIGRGAMTILIVDAAIVLIVIIGSFAGWRLIRAHSYANLLDVQQREFTEDITESESVTNIALMDSESARIFGNREIGSLSDVVSQYEVEPDYNQINLGGRPMKVSALRYASFFKWLKNRKNGIPGYVKVDPINSDADYMKLNNGMKYVPSGFFNDNLMRHVQFQYPTKIVDGYYFEIDENGNPYYICPCKSARVGLFDAMDVEGAIICDPVSGDSEYYKVEDVPTWVDRLYDGDLCTRKYDWYGILSNGYWNSVISQTGCTRTTEDYGFIALDDDVWVYTGITSLNSDQSNVGFVMINQRTSEARYYKVSGAEEFSAMRSAEGTVQEKKYEASFPSLINVKGQPTYIMVLKDSGGLVKMYAMVNVQQYNVVATGTSQKEVFENYKKQMAKEGIKTSGSETDSDTVMGGEATIGILAIQYVVSEGETTVYIKGDDGKVYKQAFADNEGLITLNEGDKIKVIIDDASSKEDDIIVMKDFEVVSSGAATTEAKASDANAAAAEDEPDTDEEDINTTEGEMVGEV